jgi:hypothetical protein
MYLIGGLALKWFEPNPELRLVGALAVSWARHAAPFTPQLYPRVAFAGSDP